MKKFMFDAAKKEEFLATKQFNEKATKLNESCISRYLEEIETKNEKRIQDLTVDEIKREIKSLQAKKNLTVLCIMKVISRYLDYCCEDCEVATYLKDIKITDIDDIRG